MANIFYATIVFLWAASSSSKLNTMECSARSLATKNCHIQWADLKVHIRGDKVNSFNGVHRNLVEFPVSGEAVKWKKLRLRRIAKQLFLEAEVWGAPAEKTGVSDLIWLVYKFKKTKAELKIKKKIQRRKLKEKSKLENDYELLDKPLAHKLYSQKKKVFWKHGFEQGELH